MRWLAPIVAALALAAGATAAAPAPDPGLTPVAAAISGVPAARAYCGGNVPGTWGDVPLADGAPLSEEYLDPIVCSYLHRFQRGWRPSPTCRHKPSRCSVGYLALAVLVVTHESIHISGDLDEPSTECKAIQRTRRTFLLLGEATNPLYVRELLRLSFWWHLQETRIFDLYSGTRPYFSPDCRPGGAMDESPGDGIWP